MLNRKKAIVGLDIGTSEVKAVELTRVGDVLRITGCGYGQIPSPEQRPETVQAVLQRAGIRTRQVATSISGPFGKEGR